MWVTVILVLVGVVMAAALAFWLVGERGRLMLPSTRRNMQASRTHGSSIGTGLHAYIYGRWTNLYVRRYLPWALRRGRGKHAKWWVDHYHSKVLTHDHAQAVVTLDHDIALRDLEQIIPFAAARDLVLNASPDVAAFECACRHAKPDHCQPSQVCMVIGQPFVDFIVEHNPATSRRLTQAEALELLQAEHERGHVHSAWFKNVMLDRFYAICNCCKCCCGGIESMTRYGLPIVASSGYVAELTAETCKNCGVCVDACPFDALSKGETSAVFDWEKCMGCGVCVQRCRQGALALARDEKKGLPMDVRMMT